ncbi:hypothetical protein QBC39DRAFT_326823 [Podospora conica]|nr:hypothetical protein QBC39DRAFT_326823 [Schizothecium conicum]
MSERLSKRLSYKLPEDDREIVFSVKLSIFNKKIKAKAYNLLEFLRAGLYFYYFLARREKFKIGLILDTLPDKKDESKIPLVRIFDKPSNVDLVLYTAVLRVKEGRKILKDFLIEEDD